MLEKYRVKSVDPQPGIDCPESISIGLLTRLGFFFLFNINNLCDFAINYSEMKQCQVVCHQF